MEKFLSKYVFINVQGVSDVSTETFANEESLSNYIYDNFNDCYDDCGTHVGRLLIPSGKAVLDYQTLIVLEIED